MTAKTSIETANKEKDARSLLAALFQHGPGIGQLLVDFFRPDPAEGETAPDVTAPDSTVPDFPSTILAIAQKLRGSILALVAADHRLFTANAEVDTARSDRDEKGSILSRQLGSLKTVCNSLVKNPVQSMGFDRQATQDHAPLLMQSERVVDHLRGAQFEADDYVFPDDDFDPKKYADRVESSAAHLREALDKVAETSRVAQAAMLDKRTKSAAFNNLYVHGARTFESYCRMVGQDEMADRIRQSVRRRQSQPEPEEVPEAFGQDQEVTRSP